MGQVNSVPAIYMNQIIFSAAKKIVSLNMEDGSLLWEYQTGGFAFSSPAISHGMFFFADDDHYFYAVDIKTLQKVWRFYLDAKFNWGSPGIAYNSVYFGSFDGSFYCIDINEGEQNWKYYHKGESWSNQHPAIADGSVVIGLADANIISLDASTGEIKWKYSAANVSFSNPIIYKGKIIVSASDGLYILE
jgi:outer membrane protein assembly factor BamB